jgi:hypothetical protein
MHASITQMPVGWHGNPLRVTSSVINANVQCGRGELSKRMDGAVSRPLQSVRSSAWKVWTLDRHVIMQVMQQH